MIPGTTGMAWFTVRLVVVDDRTPGAMGGTLVKRRAPGSCPGVLVSCEGNTRPGTRLVKAGGGLVSAGGVPGTSAPGAGGAGCASTRTTNPQTRANRIPDLAMSFTIIPG